MKELSERPLLIRIIRRLIKYLVRLVLAVIILAASVLVVVQTPPGKRLLARGLTRLASTPGTSISFRGISGILPFRVRLGELRLGDPDGDWLVIEDARVRLDIFELLSLHLHADSVSVDRVTFYRIPGAGEEGGDPVSGPGFTPAEIPSFVADRLRVRKVTAAESLFGRRLEGTLEGQVSNSVTAGPRAELLFSPYRRPGEGLSISGESAADLSRLRVELELEEKAGGTLGGMVFPGDPGPLSFEFRAAGPWEGLETRFFLRAPDRFDLRGDLVFDLSRFLAEGEINAAVTRPPFPGWEGGGELTAGLTAADGGQNLDLRIEGRGLAGPFLGVERILVTAGLEDLLRGVGGEIALEASEVTTPAGDEESAGPGDLFGEVSGLLVFTGGAASPRADLELQVRGYTVPGLLRPPRDVRFLDLTGSLTADRLELDLEATGERGFTLEAGFSAAARYSTDPLSLEFPEDGELAGSLSSELDLTFFNNYLALSRQALGGRVEADIGLDGTWGRPRPRGGIVISRGEYRNLNTGTSLDNLAGHLQFTDDRLVLEELTARTPRPRRPLLLGWTRFIPGIGYTPLADRREITGRGRITLSGATRLSPEEGYPSEYSLRFEDAMVADMDLVTAIVSGKISLQGSLEDSRLAGEVKIRHAEGRIPTHIPATVPEIEVIEINKPGEEAPRPPSRPSPFLEKLALDLRLSAPDNVIAKGRGLDSEWKAEISVSGTAAEPEIRGGLTLLDGIFIFMGEEMTLRDCSVMMDGEYPPNPQLTINARIVKPDIIMDLQVVGPIDQPEVMISSQPPYPDDEILARILFGRPASQLTGLQALQIANGLRIIQGEAGFFDLLTGLTSFLGTIQVDFTDLDGAEDQTAVRIRWSLSRKFYIETQRAIESPDTLFLARWELTRNIQLRVRSGYGLLGDAAYLHWQMNY